MATYTLRTDLGTFPARGRVWRVPRGSLLFMIGMSGAQEGEDVAEHEFGRVFQSIVIRH